MTTLSARYTKRPRIVRYCEECNRRIEGAHIRMYGHADDGNPPFNIYFHPACVNPDTKDAKLRALLAPAGGNTSVASQDGSGRTEV